MNPHKGPFLLTRLTLAPIVPFLRIRHEFRLGNICFLAPPDKKPRKKPATKPLRSRLASREPLAYILDLRARTPPPRSWTYVAPTTFQHPLDDRVVRYRSPLRNHHHPVADHEVLGLVAVLNTLSVNDLHVPPDPAVLVDDRPLHPAPLADAEVRLPQLAVAPPVGLGLKKVRPHDHRLPQARPPTDLRADPHHALLDRRPRPNRAPVRYQALLHRRPQHPRRRQEPRPSVDQPLRSMEIKRRLRRRKL